MTEKPLSLAEDFQKYFTIDLATDAEQRALAYGIRYRVYCQEFGYESTQAFPQAMETDDFDASSLHCLITHKSSGLPAGTVRLVYADGSSKLPMEKYCADAIDNGFIDRLQVRRDTICEVSRLAVDGAFRRRGGEKVSRFGELDALDISRREERTFSLIAVSTFVAAFVAAELTERKNCFAMMEPFLPRMLRRSGIYVESAGRNIDYHGIRAPYFVTQGAAFEGMVPDLQDLYLAIKRRFERQLNRTEWHTSGNWQSIWIKDRAHRQVGGVYSRPSP